MRYEVMVEELEQVQAPLSDNFWIGLGIGAGVALAIVTVC